MNAKHLSLILSFSLLALACSSPGDTKPKTKQSKDGTVTHVNSESKVKSEVQVKDGVTNGVAKSYYPNGKLWKKAIYNNGHLDGRAEVYDREGRLIRTVEYEMGREHGLYTRYFKSGREKLQIEYHQGRPLPGLLRRDYRGEDLAEPEILLKKQGNIDPAQNLFRVIFELKEDSREVAFYGLPAGTSWEDLNQAELSQYRLPTLKGSPNKAYLDHQLDPGYFVTVELTIYAVFEIAKGRDAAVKKEITYSIENSDF